LLRGVLLRALGKHADAAKERKREQGKFPKRHIILFLTGWTI
jgi:hypothetical protein